MPARILKESGDSVNVQLQSGAKKTVKRSAKEPLWPLNHSSLNRIEDDLVMVDAINQVCDPKHSLCTHSGCVSFEPLNVCEQEAIDAEPMKRIVLFRRTDACLSACLPS